MTDHAATRESAPSRRRLWFGVAAPPVAWSLHTAASFFLFVGLCRHGHHQAAARVLVLVVTALGLAGCGAGGAVAYAAWAQLRGGRRLIEAEGRGQDEMLALVGLFMAVIFGVGVIWAGLQSLVMGDLCEWTR